VEFEEENDDVVDRTHLFLLIELFGPIPRHITRRSKHYFTARGEIRGLDYEIDPTTSLCELMRDDGLAREAAEAWSEFLQPFFRFSPRKRIQNLTELFTHELLTN